MDVHIEITGLHLFALDPAGTAVHVLAPATSAGHQHRPSLSHRDLPGAQPLHDRKVDLSGLRPGGSITWPLAHVLDIEATGGRKLPASQIGPTPDATVASRIILPLPTWVEPGRLVDWEVPGGQVTELTHQLTWIIEDVDEAFGMEHRPLRATGAGQGLPWPAAERIKGREVRRIFLDHLPNSVHCIDEGQPADHVQFYYAMTGGAGGNPILREPPVPGCKEETNPSLERMKTLAFNCMLGQTTVG